MNAGAYASSAQILASDVAQAHASVNDARQGQEGTQNSANRVMLTGMAPNNPAWVTNYGELVTTHKTA